MKRTCENCGNSKCSNSVIAIFWDECVKSGFTKHWRPKENAESPYPDGDTSILACPQCGSGEYLHNEDGAENAFCGQCGQPIEWEVAEQ